MRAPAVGGDRAEQKESASTPLSHESAEVMGQEDWASTVEGNQRQGVLDWPVVEGPDAENCTCVVDQQPDLEIPCRFVDTRHQVVVRQICLNDSGLDAILSLDRSRGPAKFVLSPCEHHHIEATIGKVTAEALADSGFEEIVATEWPDPILGEAMPAQEDDDADASAGGA